MAEQHRLDLKCQLTITVKKVCSAQLLSLSTYAICRFNHFIT